MVVCDSVSEFADVMTLLQKCKPVFLAMLVVANVGIGQIFNCLMKCFVWSFVIATSYYRERSVAGSAACFPQYSGFQVGLVIEGGVTRVELMRTVPTDTRWAKR